jgi:hypothetical protein
LTQLLSAEAETLIILDLEHWTAIVKDDAPVIGGVYTNADASTWAAPGQGHAAAIASAQGNRTFAMTDTTVRIYNSANSAITDSMGSGYAYSNTGNQSSRAYANSISYSIDT